ncbi:MAG: hypothetical protein ACJ76H_03670 [Bacteriovoracaceae bacterium]
MKRYLLSGIVGLGLLLVPALSGALTPVEGILLGTATTEIQTDPLSLVFSNTNGNVEDDEFKKLKKYQANLWTGVYFEEDCSTLGPITYSTTWKEQQAKRSIVATLQYIGLDATIKAIGAYAKNLHIPDTEYENMTSNLVSLYCSENVTVMSLRTIRNALAHYYQNPDMSIIPTVENSPYATEAFKSGSASSETRSRELQLAIKNFRSFCSWGGDSADYRMLPPYLKNPFIMAMITRSMQGKNFTWNDQQKRFIFYDDPKVVRVVCKDLICRQSTPEVFNKEFPLSTGSTGLKTDLNKLYCQQFRYLDYDHKKTIPEVKEWIKAQQIEDPYFETGFFVSLMTGVSDPFMSQSKFSNIPAIVKSSVDERWTKWSKDSLNVFSRDLLFEESIKVRAMPRRQPGSIREGLLLDFHVTLGEMDRIMRNNDKIHMSFDFKFSKNWLRTLITRWNYISGHLDVEGDKALHEDVARYIELQLRTKEKLFTQKVWNDDFPRLLADELLAQVLSYRGTYFETYQDEMVTVPVRFSYGVFALSYLRYKSQVAKGSTELNL